MSRTVSAAMLAVMLAAPASSDAASHSSYDTGYCRAARHGYSASQANCYGNLFSQHAALNRYSHYAIAGSKGRRSPFRALAWQQCGISL